MRVFAVPDITGIKLFSRLRLDFSLQHDHKFRCKFEDTINLLYSCGKCIDFSYMLSALHTL